MDTSSEYHEPIYFDKTGCYITVPQLRFFINRKDGRRKFISGSTEFVEYFQTCRSYNLISDLMLEDENCSTMYWDEKLKTAVFSFPVNGKVARKFSEVGILPAEKDSYEI